MKNSYVASFPQINDLWMWNNLVQQEEELWIAHSSDDTIICSDTSIA